MATESVVADGAEKQYPPKPTRKNFKDREGDKVGKLTVGRYLGQKKTVRRDGRSYSDAMWECHCECGTIKEMSGVSLGHPETKACGCLARTHLGDHNRTHGKSGLPEYKVWKGMKGRCLNKKSKHYRDYGARGIGVFPAWVTSFEEFFKYVGPRPNNDGNYEPGNVRWAVQLDQEKNKRSSRKVTINGVTKIITDWSHESGVNVHTIGGRLDRGWPPEIAVFRPAGNRSRQSHLWQTSDSTTT